jgi:hypothetical protein
MAKSLLDKMMLPEGGLLGMAFDACVGAVELCGRGIQKFSDAIDNLGGSNRLSENEGFLARAKEALGLGGKDAPQIAAPSPATEINTPTVSLARQSCEFDPKDLGCLAPPTFINTQMQQVAQGAQR